MTMNLFIVYSYFPIDLTYIIPNQIKHLGYNSVNILNRLEYRQINNPDIYYIKL